MRRRTCAWLVITALSMLSHAASAQEQGPVAAAALNSLLVRVGESVGRRYDLDEATVDSLRQSLRETGSASARENGHSAMLVALLSQPAVAAAFREYLSEEQLQDFADSTYARRRRDRHAASLHVTAWADQQFSLSVEQRAKMEELLVHRTRNVRGLSARRMVWDRWDQRFVILRAWLTNPRDGVLTGKQLGVWQALVRRGPGRRDGDEWPVQMEAREVEFRRRVDEVARAADLGEIPDEELGPRLRGLKKRLYMGESAVDDARREADTRIAETGLAAHTEQLGHLDAYAEGRLALVAKGVAQLHFEAVDDAAEDRLRHVEAQLGQSVADGALTSKEATEALDAFKEDIRREHAMALDDITGHALYQHTIKEALSEEAFARYRALQTQRLAFRQQALRDLAVACMDAHLLLSDDQRRSLEATAAEVSAWPETDGIPAAAAMLSRLTQRARRELLSPWQQDQLRGLRQELTRCACFSR